MKQNNWQIYFNIFGDFNIIHFLYVFINFRWLYDFCLCSITRCLKLYWKGGKCMRLSDENTREGRHLTPEERIALQAEKIKQLQQENNGWRERYDELDAGHSRLFKDFCKLQQENEQLQAQVARMREALTVANNYMPDVGQFCACGKCKTCGADINYVGYVYCVKCARVIIDEALSDTPADYHNPTDVEVLRKAREALVECIDALELCTHNELCKIAVSPYDMIRDAKEALAEIDKAIGGRKK